MLNSLRAKWKNRKKYDSFAEMPDWLLVFFAIAGFIIAGFYGFVLSKVMPSYIETANKISPIDWGWKGWILSAILAAIGSVVWHFGSIAWRCNTILRERWYK